MKKYLILVAAAIAMNVNAQKVAFKIKGSDTVLPLTQKEAEVYMNKHAGSSIMVTGGGSGVGISALLTGTTDIAQASRKLKLDEKTKLAEMGKAYKETIIAYDALSIIVNPANKVSKLTREQLEGIFTGKITNWKQVGGNDMKIIVYSRESSSGTYDFIEEHVMKLKNYTPSALLMPATGAIVQSVSQTKGAIGYVGFAYLEKSVKALDVSYDGGKTFVTPTMENAKSKKYPITRPLFYYYLKTTEKSISPYVNFVLSSEGQKIVLKEGYIPLN
jgi:phosphate transport system substrate-binding protein